MLAHGLASSWCWRRNYYRRETVRASPDAGSTPRFTFWYPQPRIMCPRKRDEVGCASRVPVGHSIHRLGYTDIRMEGEYTHTCRHGREFPFHAVAVTVHGEVCVDLLGYWLTSWPDRNGR